MATESSQEEYCNRAKEVKEFDDSKIGVKGLVDSGIITIPRFFIHPPENLTGIRSHHPEAIQIPTIDLSDHNSIPARSHIVQQIRDAASQFGFFHIVNHGIPVSIMDATISAVKAFHELGTEEKKSHYDRSGEGGVYYATNYDLFISRVATWRDTLEVQTAPVPPDWKRVPAICQSELMEWSRQTKSLGEVLAELLCQGLRLQQDRLKELKCMDLRSIVGHCYPHCPQPYLTLGINSHTDPLVLTILLQSEVEGLQAKIGEDWINIKPMHGALVVNIGDLLQIMSNGVYKSVEHRVVANSNKDSRISIAAFLGPTEKEGSRSYGPLPELLSEEKPALYRNFTMEEFMTQFFSKELCVLVNHFKI
ncbi:1-aminocyclopropane-1-carboxylate oxidase homolog 4-like [Aristolochia californica]|uniref:1-aminocyclopropane-1-carboxylate oxidase homolog 4-like n=1 Tax=Aristolochia californica TaxID=171875 RepID=UPI0035E290FC